ncbi:MAG TPA: 5-(carboxyamino)imidazole ribonucleotide synthase [Bacillota bacterium]|nr:5-(carboxyamino)imidazole ribonucleotide synthase [Bacillota bacterium]
MSNSRVILPGSTIGILGGGQLGLMLALQARAMGYRVASLDPDEECPAAAVSDFFLQFPFSSLAGADALAAVSDVITYEFENVSADLAKALEQQSYLPQGYQLLYQTRNRIREKNALAGAGVPTAQYRPVADFDGLVSAVDELGLPAVFKTVEGGYDGKGQWVLHTTNDVSALKGLLHSGRQFVLEQFVPFVKELSIIVAGNAGGEVRCFPLVENVHRNNILHTTIAPGRVDLHVSESAHSIALALAHHFRLIGLLAIELFLLADGSLLVNELAPRPHNSGHFTQDACACSQFEQHIRAICNLPLCGTQIDRPTIMVNVLGENLEALLKAYKELPPEWKVHLYGKKQIRTGRKMGHINMVGADLESAEGWMARTGFHGGAYNER